MPNPRRSANVIALPDIELPFVGVAASASEGVHVHGSRSEVWLVQCYDQDSQGRMLYIKPALTHNAMLVELLCNQVGKCMRLPCPDAFLVTVRPHHVGRPRSHQSMLAFGCEQVGTHSQARPIKNVEVLLRLLDKLHLTNPLAAFDELIANSVRSPDDVLIDPNGGAAIIDHEGAMEMLDRPTSDVTNWLAQRMLARTPEDDRPALAKAVRACAASAYRMRLNSPPLAVQYAQDGIAIYDKLLNFLQQRLEALDGLLSQRFDPQQKYLTIPAQQHHEAS